MENTLIGIAKWILNQGTEITVEVLENTLQEVYNKGRLDSYLEEVDKTLDNIRYNTMMEIKRRKKLLYERNFYNSPSDEDIIEMKALEYIEKNIRQIIIQYKEG